MKKTVSVLLGTVVLLLTVLYANIISPAKEQLVDIEKTQLGATDTYYAFEASTGTLTISGIGMTPNFRNDSVSQPWYEWRDESIKKVVVEEGITALGDYFFYNVRAADFELPSTLTTIGNYTLSGINSAESITLPEGLTSIGNNAFYYSTNLKSITIPAAVTKIGSSAFENCLSLESVVFADMYSDISVGSKAFLRCPQLKSVDVPKRAALMSYSFGFEKNKVGYVYKDFVLNVYRDSPAYTYAKDKIKNTDNYHILNEFKIKEGQSVDCEYFIDSFRNEMYFIFIPAVSDNYKFFSMGSVDVDCIYNETLYDDNSLDDLNFTVEGYLEAGREYVFTVKCVSEMSLGSFTVCMENTHSYVRTVVPETLTTDGYTLYNCENCGYSYKTDFVKRLGVHITGRVLLMEKPDGSSVNHYPVRNAYLSAGGKNITVTDSDGNFDFYVPASVREFSVSTPFAVSRIVEIVSDADMNMKLGDITLFNDDYHPDGYVNAKDFAVFRKLYGEYTDDNRYICEMLDYNQDGIIDDEDFRHAENFFTYGKITESIYD